MVNIILYFMPALYNARDRIIRTQRKSAKGFYPIIRDFLTNNNFDRFPLLYSDELRMLRISWTEKKTNANVLREGYVQRSLLKTVRKRQMEFLGHVCRRRCLEFLSLTKKLEGKRDRGKQRITFLDSLCNSATGGQSKGLHFLKLSDDRDFWRGMVANVCFRSGT